MGPTRGEFGAHSGHRAVPLVYPDDGDRGGGIRGRDWRAQKESLWTHRKPAFLCVRDLVQSDRSRSLVGSRGDHEGPPREPSLLGVRHRVSWLPPYPGGAEGGISVGPENGDVSIASPKGRVPRAEPVGECG